MNNHARLIRACWPLRHSNVIHRRAIRHSVAQLRAAAIGENHSYGPGNPDWEHDFDRERSVE